MSKLIAIIRIRGSMETRSRTEDSLKQMHLGRKHSCILMQDTPQLHGFLIQCRDFITWGEVDEKLVSSLLAARGGMEGGKKLTDSELSKSSKFKSIDDFSKALVDGSAKLKDVPSIKPLFRLSPPRKGFKGSIKLPYPKGALGNRKEKICELIGRML
ncbi:MAG: 50S ribosomal protein L30 [Candidatus Micrarchaeota archaeon]